MRILYLATSFPEPDKGDTIYTDLASALFQAGHVVTVAVSEQAKNNRQTALYNERGYDVLRIVTGNYYDVGLIEKGITTLKMPALMRRGITKHLNNRTFDFILFEAPPVTNEKLVSWAKRKFKCACYLMLKDIFPQNAVDLEIMKSGGIFFKYFKSREMKLYKTADFIGCMSDANKSYILKHNPWLEQNKIEIFPNTKKVSEFDLPNYDDIRERYGIPKSSCVFLFGGNMGRPQYVQLLCQTIISLKDVSEIFFVFAGRGTDRYKLEQAIREHGIKNALAIENLPRDDFDQLTRVCDVGLIVLDPRFTIPNYPSRILSYMEYAKPVLAATDRVSDIKDLIESVRFGSWVWSGDSDLFAKKVIEMANRCDLIELGKNGRDYIETHLTVEKSVKILEGHFAQKEAKHV